MKRKRWWPVILTGCLLFISAGALVHGYRDTPFVIGLFPFLLLIAAQKIVGWLDGESVDDENVRFFARAWVTSLFLFTAFYQSLELFETPYELRSYVPQDIWAVVLYSVLGYLAVGVVRIAVWPRSVSLRGVAYAMIGVVGNSLVLFVAVFIIPKIDHLH